MHSLEKTETFAYHIQYARITISNLPLYKYTETESANLRRLRSKENSGRILELVSSPSFCGFVTNLCWVNFLEKRTPAGKARGVYHIRGWWGEGQWRVCLWVSSPRGSLLLEERRCSLVSTGGLVLLSANLSLGTAPNPKSMAFLFVQSLKSGLFGCLWGGKASRIEGIVFFCSLPFSYWWVLQEKSALWPFARS